MINRDGERKPVSSAIRNKQKNKVYDYYGAAGVIDQVDNYLFDERLLLIGEDGANLLSRSKNNAFFADGKYWVNNHAHVLDATNKDLLDFVAMVINSIKLDEYITGSAQPKLSQDNLNKIPIPLPPLQEQKRIAKSINYWFSLVDCIEKSKGDLQESIKQAKSKILDLAIHGKLVPQDPTDEPARELLKRINPKAEIACDNAQYGKLPKGWCLLPLLSLCDCYQPKTISMSQLDENGAYPVYGANGVIGRYNQYNHREQEILLTCRGATCGEVNKSESYSWINGNAMVLHPLFGINKDFIYYLAHTFKKHDGLISGTAQPQITRINLGKLFIGLPPLNEQHRIVAKIEELFVQLDNIALSL